MSSIIRSRGGKCVHPELDILPASALRDTSKVILLVLDGLGEEQLTRYIQRNKSASSVLAHHPHDVISTVCPATTATAVTTFATGSSPAEHGILGWHVQFPDLGLVGTPLPYTTRTGTPLTPPDFPLEKYLDIPSPLAGAKDRKVLISYAHIPGSQTSMAQPWWNKRVAYETLDEFFMAIQRFLRSPGRGFAYAYWPNYDALCHVYGPEASAPARHLAELDIFLEKVNGLVRKANAAVLVTADHGLVRSRQAIIFDQIPGLYSTLTVLPSGDARLFHCFVRPAKVKEFLRIMKSPPLSEACVCIRGEQAIAAGLFGPGKPNRHFEGRVGDYILLARDGYSFVAPAAFSKYRKAMKGVHGGLSAAEMRVPLFRL